MRRAAPTTANSVRLLVLSEVAARPLAPAFKEPADVIADEFVDPGLAEGELPLLSPPRLGRPAASATAARNSALLAREALPAC